MAIYPDFIANAWVEMQSEGFLLKEISKFYGVSRYNIIDTLDSMGLKKLFAENRPYNGKRNSLDVLEKRIKINKNGCWIWQGQINNSGYGVLKLKSKANAVHRLMYTKYKGNCDGKFVCHTCDVRSCCNPDHLFLGTCKDNMVDMARKLRSSAQKLTPFQVLEIRERLKANQRGFIIAKEMNVSQGIVCCIKKEYTYKWLRTLNDVIIK